MTSPAFAAPLALASSTLVAAPVTCARPSRRASTSAPPPPVALAGWDLVRRAAAAAGAAGALFALAPAPAVATPRHRPVVAAANADVEAAAVTLGAVAFGGLVVKKVLGARGGKDQQRVDEACRLLAEEEAARALRKERRKMEDVDEEVQGDDELLSSFMRRVKGLENGEEEEGEEEEVMRMTPLPETGSGARGGAVLDREDEVREEKDDESVDMLKRMWKLDLDDGGKK